VRVTGLGSWPGQAAVRHQRRQSLTPAARLVRARLGRRDFVVCRFRREIVVGPAGLKLTAWFAKQCLRSSLLSVPQSQGFSMSTVVVRKKAECGLSIENKRQSSKSVNAKGQFRYETPRIGTTRARRPPSLRRIIALAMMVNRRNGRALKPAEMPSS
jgi:hypothetical protein